MRKASLFLATVFCAALVSCNKENPTDTAVPAGGKTYTLSVNASKLATKALEEAGKNINATWGASDVVKVCKNGSATAIGTLTPLTTGSADASLTGTVTLTGVSVGDKLDLIFPRETWSYEGQTGTLAGIAENFDYATATVTVSAINGENLKTSDAEFVNQQAIVKFTIFDSSDNSLRDVKSLTISAASGKLVKSYAVSDDSYTPVYGDIVVTPSSATSEFYVALRNNSAAADTYTLTANYDNFTNYTYVKSGVTFAKGQYRAINVKMTKEAEIYTVAGSPIEVFGSSWNQDDSANDMVKQADGTYRKTYQLTGTEIGPIEFKVLKGRSFGEAWPSENYKINVKKGTLVITFDPSTKVVNAYIESDAYTIAGDDYSLFGASWVPSETANDMVKQDDGTFLKNYTIPSSLVGINIQFKVAKDHKWDESWGKDGGSDNYTYEIPHTGTLHISFDPTTHDIDAWMDDIRYSIAATFNGWDKSANPMIKQANGTYKSEVSVPAGYPTIEYKVVHAETDWIGDPNNGDNNYSFNLGGDGATVLFFTYDPSNNSVTVEESRAKLYFRSDSPVKNELCFRCSALNTASWPGTVISDTEIIAGSKYYFIEYPTSLISGQTISDMYIVDKDNWNTNSSTLTFSDSATEFFIVAAESADLYLLSGRPSEPQISIDGTFADWAEVSGNSNTESNGNVSLLKAYSDGTSLFLYHKMTPGSGVTFDTTSGWRYFRVYFDTDNNATTGWDTSHWLYAGADELLYGEDGGKHDILVYHSKAGVSNADINGLSSSYELKSVANSDGSIEVELKFAIDELGAHGGEIKIYTVSSVASGQASYGILSGVIIP